MPIDVRLAWHFCSILVLGEGVAPLLVKRSARVLCYSFLLLRAHDLSCVGQSGVYAFAPSSCVTWFCKQTDCL